MRLSTYIDDVISAHVPELGLWHVRTVVHDLTSSTKRNANNVPVIDSK